MSTSEEEVRRSSSLLYIDTSLVRNRVEDDLGPRWKVWRRRRFLVTFLSFLGFMNIYTNRADLSVALTAMVKRHGNKGSEFDWSLKVEGLVLSSFYYGYITLQLVGGWMAHRVGGVKLYGFGVGIPSFIAIYTQYFARSSYIALIWLRIVQGILQGVCYPSMHDIWAHWIPPLERNFLASIAYSGAYIGVILAMTTSGLISNGLGWPAVFHIFGGLGTLWYGFWLAFVHRVPEHDQYIDYRELRYLRKSVVRENEKDKLSPPWKEIFTSRPVYALVVCHIAINWGGITMLTQLPIFLQDILGYNLAESGFLSAVPSIIMACSVPITGRIVDVILRKELMTLTVVRKVFITTGFIMEGTIIFFVGFVTNPSLAMILLTLGVASAAISEPNYMVSHLDIAPQYASILLGICSTVATISGIVSPQLTSYIVFYEKKKGWKIVFMIVGGFYWLAAIVYVLFGSAELQTWAIEKPQEDKEEEEKDISSDVLPPPI